jgi:hypothetical protein
MSWPIRIGLVLVFNGPNKETVSPAIPLVYTAIVEPLYVYIILYHVLADKFGVVTIPAVPVEL